MVKENVRFLILVAIFTFCLFGIAALAGCSKYDIKYAECLVRDSTSNPCN